MDKVHPSLFWYDMDKGLKDLFLRHTGQTMDRGEYQIQQDEEDTDSDDDSYIDDEGGQSNINPR